MKKLILGLAIFAGLMQPAFASEDDLDNIEGVVYYEDYHLDEVSLKEEASEEIREVKEEIQEVQEETEEIKEENKDVHPDRVALEGENTYGGATDSEPGLVSYRNYKPGILADFDIRSENPDHIDGTYINKFFDKRSHHTPLKGQGDTIMKYSEKFGINVGIFLGQIAKETTFGRDPAGGKYNFGSVRYSPDGIGSEYGYKMARGSKWINPPTVEAGVETLFRLMRVAYADKGYTTYKAFINRYAPAFENNHISFERLALGTMNALNMPY